MIKYLFKFINICLITISVYNSICLENDDIYVADHILGDTQELDVEPVYSAGANVVSSPGSAGKGTLIQSSGLSFIKFGNNNAVNLPISAVIGITEKIDILFGLPLSRLDVYSVQQGLGDIFLGINWFYLDRPLFNFKSGCNAAIIFPSGAAGLTNIDNKIDIILTNSINYQLDKYSLDFMLKLNIIDNVSGEKDLSLGYGISCSRGWSEKLSTSFEMVGSTVKNSNGKINPLFFIGINYKLFTRVGTSFVIGRNVFSDGVDIMTNLGFTYVF